MPSELQLYETSALIMILKRKHKSFKRLRSSLKFSVGILYKAKISWCGNHSCPSDGDL